MKLHPLLALAVSLGLITSAFGDHHKKSPFLTGLMNIYHATTKKVVDLAEAIPEDKYDWQPAEEVNSVKSAIGHVAAANYFFGGMLGAEVPEGINPRALADSIANKEEAIATLKASAKFAAGAIKAVPESEYGDEIDFFGTTVPKIQLLMMVAGHTNEHLGQLIAYARSNDVTPPWSIPNPDGDSDAG